MDIKKNEMVCLLTLFIVCKQNKARDDASHQMERQIRVLNNRVHELELANSSADTHVKSLSEKLKRKSEELEIARAGINNIEPRVAQLEPEVTKLRAERESWMEERVRLNHELSTLRPIDETLAKLTTELLEVKILEENHAHSNALLAASASKDKRQKKVLASRQHAAWIGIPCLRSLCPTLYDFIRRLSADLTHTESIVEELEASVNVLRSDLETAHAQHTQDQMRLLHANELSDAALTECRDRVLTLESELVRVRSAKTVLEQLRVVLLSFPGGIEVLFDAVGLQKTPVSSHFSASSRRNTTPGSEAAVESKLGDGHDAMTTPIRSKVARYEEEIKKVVTISLYI
jgi:chromosome segregation ATPase